MRAFDRNQFAVQRRPWMQDVAFYILNRHHERGTSVGVVEFRPHTPGEEATPTLSVDEEAVQALFEELWSLGFRSARDKGSNPEALDEARRDHIADLRKAAKLA